MVCLQCAKCGEEFKFRQTLLRHLMGHMEITPYLCAHCSHASRFKSCVRKHAAKMHSTSGNDNDVITDEIEEGKVKLLTNKLRIFYTPAAGGSIQQPQIAAADQAVLFNNHSLASLLAAAAAAQQQQQPSTSAAAALSEEEMEEEDASAGGEAARHIGTVADVDDDDEEYEDVIEMEEEDA